MNSLILIVIILGVFAGFPWSILGLLACSYGAYGGPEGFLWAGVGIIILACSYNLKEHLKNKVAKQTISDSTSIDEAKSTEELIAPPSKSWLVVGLTILAVIVACNLFFDTLGFIINKYLT